MSAYLDWRWSDLSTAAVLVGVLAALACGWPA